MPSKKTKRVTKRVSSPPRHWAVLHPPGVWKLLYDHAQDIIRERAHEREFPESIAVHLKRLCQCVADPRLMCTDGRESEIYRFVFARAFSPEPELFLELVSELVQFRRQMNLIVLALTDYPEISYMDERGKIIIKDINTAESKEVAYFMKEEFGIDISHRAVARARERLAEKQRRNH